MSRALVAGAANGMVAPPLHEGSLRSPSFRSGATIPVSLFNSAIPILDFLPTLYIKLPWGRCLIIIGTEGDGDEFERFTVEVWRRLLNDKGVQRYGRPGQAQRGVDIIGRRPTGEWVGIQCKVRQTASAILSEAKMDVAAAKLMNPRIDEFVLATTLRRDVNVQDFARSATDANAAAGLFKVSTFFWDDFEAVLLDRANMDLMFRFYRDCIIEVTPGSMAVGRLFRARIGVEEITTQYELLIGKTPDLAPTDTPGANLAYFKGLAYMVDLNMRRAAVFAVPCGHDSDIETAITNRFDRHIITKWINRFRDVDDLLGCDGEEFQMTISRDEWRMLVDRYADEAT
jgi:hypothetical protein